MDIRADLELILPDATPEEIDAVILYIAKAESRVAAEEEIYRKHVEDFLATLTP